jgi:hypothetical protein
VQRFNIFQKGEFQLTLTPVNNQSNALLGGLQLHAANRCCPLLHCHAVMEMNSGKNRKIVLDPDAEMVGIGAYLLSVMRTLCCMVRAQPT